ncbi:hypothetical protein Tco_0414172 [Tanacetum coccineum]
MIILVVESEDNETTNQLCKDRENEDARFYVLHSYCIVFVFVQYDKASVVVAKFNELEKEDIGGLTGLGGLGLPAFDRPTGGMPDRLCPAISQMMQTLLSTPYIMKQVDDV